MQGAHSEFAAAGANLVLIGQATPADASHFRRQFKIELPVLADERRQSYKAVGAKMAGVGGLFGPKVVIRGIRTLVGDRVTQGRTIGHPAQLGAAFVFAPGDEVRFEHVSANASDNVSPEDLLAAVRGRPARA